MENQQSTHDFPYDVLENILSRLPIKSLLRFKTVCKSWNAMIKDPGFAETHSKQSNISNSRCFFASYSFEGDTYCLIKFKGHEFYMESVFQFQPEEYKFDHILCSCEGILLFEHTNRETLKKKFVLLNPFTRNISTFSCPFSDEIHATRFCRSESYGLCFDKYEDDYKFIVVFRGGRYLVYSIKNDSWVERRSELTGCVRREGTYVNGVVYWVMSKCSSPFPYTGIVYFDPKYDLLKKLHGPEDLEHHTFFFLTNLTGNLCLYTRFEGFVIRIWLLKEHEHGGGRKRWMKLASVDMGEPPEEEESEFFYAGIPLCLTSENEIVFQDLPWGGKYAVYHPDKQKFGEVKEFPWDTRIAESSCLESLHFPAIRRE
ncbi:F-box/kelch-repeat protein At3g23880-like [Primulina huaijiensis]|uniref:F-box/kelch-repeat protein At3g23880-like n=1 Tax=Primulina huaijiensis TaxID=1492673 RepID=UPI003CC732B9